MAHQTVVLAYSGGLDTSVAIPWLREKGLEVVAATVDVGQPGDFQQIREKAVRSAHTPSGYAAFSTLTPSITRPSRASTAHPTWNPEYGA